jgi:SAM-dependent methyltransferase
MYSVDLREYSKVDFSMLNTVDMVNLIMQRSSSLKGIIPRRNSVDDWRATYAELVEKHRDEILERIWAEVRSTYMSSRGALIATRPYSVADIGCGQGLLDLLIYDDTAAKLLLIDIEESEAVFFGFKESGGAGYASLQRAREFLEANGVPGANISLLNPNESDVLSAGPVDVACSFLSCGFHYPVTTYDQFFKTQVRRSIIIDVRNGRGDENELSAYGQPFLISEPELTSSSKYMICK